MAVEMLLKGPSSQMTGALHDCFATGHACRTLSWFVLFMGRGVDLFAE
jgi:hypothetical protein